MFPLNSCCVTMRQQIRQAILPGEGRSLPHPTTVIRRPEQDAGLALSHAFAHLHIHTTADLPQANSSKLQETDQVDHFKRNPGATIRGANAPHLCMPHLLESRCADWRGRRTWLQRRRAPCRACNHHTGTLFWSPSPARITYGLEVSS